MKCKAALLALILTGCTPAEVQIAETVFHEAEVAEEAIENDLECPSCARPQQGMYIAPGSQNAQLQPASPISDKITLGCKGRAEKSQPRQYQHKGA
jgi:4-hydroxy-3-methylbut-2-en-1-yl diphosphate synthase IspG/GcpE